MSVLERLIDQANMGYVVVSAGMVGMREQDKPLLRDNGFDVDGKDGMVSYEFATTGLADRLRDAGYHYWHGKLKEDLLTHARSGVYSIANTYSDILLVSGVCLYESDGYKCTYNTERITGFSWENPTGEFGHMLKRAADRANGLLDDGC